ncbi:MAG: hypothetical protein FWH27_07130 [Planctomycetaceae bacterium]|nr:hypothetical protein [Planctomycetaceae bacterium]
MKIIRTQATGTGQVVSYAKFIESKLVPASILRRLTDLVTTIPNVLTDVIDYCKGIDPQYTFRVIIPNSFTSASFDVALAGQDFQILCSRRLIRGWFPFNPLAANFGSNYDVIFSVMADEAFESNLLKTLKNKYMTYDL